MEADTEIPLDRFRPSDHRLALCLSIYSRIGAGLSREVLGGHSGRILDAEIGRRFLLWRFMRARRRRCTTRTPRRRRRARAARVPPRRSAAAKDAAQLELQISPPPREFASFFMTFTNNPLLPRPPRCRSARDRARPRSPRRRFSPRGRPPRRRRLRLFDLSVRTSFTLHQLPTASRGRCCFLHLHSSSAPLTASTSSCAPARRRRRWRGRPARRDPQALLKTLAH